MAQRVVGVQTLLGSSSSPPRGAWRTRLLALCGALASTACGVSPPRPDAAAAPDAAVADTRAPDAAPDGAQPALDAAPALDAVADDTPAPLPDDAARPDATPAPDGGPVARRCRANTGGTTSPAGAMGADPLASLRAGHPRLYLHADDFTRLRAVVARDATAAEWYRRLRARADAMLATSPVRVSPDGRGTILNEARTAYDRISTLAGIYRLDGDARRATRAIAEMTAMAALANWNPVHFLDVAEITNGMAIGYDWLYDVMTPAQRASVRDAIVRNGLGAGREVFEWRAMRTRWDRTWWVDDQHNWNAVCNGALLAGALAVGDEAAADTARYIIEHARASVLNSQRAFAPQGATPEGPGYWGYGVGYTRFFIDAAQSALGTDFGMRAMPGFAETALFRMHFIGPLTRTFNFADVGSDSWGGWLSQAPHMLWLAREFDRPEFFAHERDHIDNDYNSLNIFHLLAYDEGCAAASAPGLPLDALFAGGNGNVAFMRSAWGDRNAWYVGVKGGNNAANHGHLDLGTFVLDALGQRWAVDLGSDDYSLPDREALYRVRTEGHNTLTISATAQTALAFASQAGDARAPIVGFVSGAARSHAVADLTAAYPRLVASARRGIALLGRGQQVIVQDEVTPAQSVEVIWNFHTGAAVTTAGATATLAQGGQTLEARILSPAGATFATVTASPPAPQNPNTGVRNLIVRLPRTSAPVRLVVRFAQAGASVPAPAIEPLDAWVSAGRVTP